MKLAKKYEFEPAEHKPKSLDHWKTLLDFFFLSKS